MSKVISRPTNKRPSPLFEQTKYSGLKLIPKFPIKYSEYQLQANMQGTYKRTRRHIVVVKLRHRDQAPFDLFLCYSRIKFISIIQD